MDERARRAPSIVHSGRELLTLQLRSDLCYEADRLLAELLAEVNGMTASFRVRIDRTFLH